MIYLARHGETEFNRERRLQGHVDSPLTELGVRQAHAMGRLLKDLVRDPAGWRIISSPLGRARRTAEIIAGEISGALSVELDPRLMEITLGEHDGRLRSEMAADQPAAFGPSGWIFDAPTCESFQSVSARLESWLGALPPEPHRRVIAVSHGVTGRVLRGLYAGLGPDDTAHQDVPQDAVYLLNDGGVARIDCEPLD
jgi:broad specificity phosphatase PhoE